MSITEEETNKAQFRRTYEELFHQGNPFVREIMGLVRCTCFLLIGGALWMVAKRRPVQDTIELFPSNMHHQARP